MLLKLEQHLAKLLRVSFLHHLSNGSELHIEGSILLSDVVENGNLHRKHSLLLISPSNNLGFVE